MMKFLSKYRYCLVGTGLIALDVATKWWARTCCLFERQILPFVTCEVVHNHGISFGWFAQYGWIANHPIILIGASYFLYLWLISLHDGSRKKTSALGEVLVIAGGIGNLIDRFLYGHVIDFIYVHVGSVAFPYYFNIADVCIVLGVTYILVRALNK